MLASVTRLRVCSLTYLLPFLLSSRKISRQAEHTGGNRGIRLRRTRGLAFWTLTRWDDRESMESLRRSGAHRNAMPKLQHWCDQAAVASWETQDDEFPGWDEGRRRLVEHGRLSRVLHPSPEHAAGHIVVD